MKNAYALGYQRKDRKLLIVAVVFLLAAALFFSYHVIVLFSGGGAGPAPAPAGDVSTNIASVKGTFDGISTELDNIARLI